MRRKILLLIFGFVLSWTSLGNNKIATRQNEPLEKLQLLNGEWTHKLGKLIQNKKEEGYYLALCRNYISDDVEISVKGMAVSENQFKYGCIGIVCKFIDQNNYIAARFGAYGKLSILILKNGRKKIIKLNTLKLKLGKIYKCKVILSNGLLIVKINDTPLGVVKDPFAGKSGLPGLMAMSQAAFSSISISTAKANIQALKSENKACLKVIEAGDKLAFEAVEYSISPNELIAREANPDYRSIAVYLRNKSNTATSVDNIFIDGIPSKTLIESGQIAWWRSWPHIIRPGELTQVLIKMSGQDYKRTIQSFLGVAGAPCKFSFKSSGETKPLSIKFSLKPERPPLRINFIAFSKDLKTLYAYVSATKEYEGKRIKKVEVNGTDVTAQTYLPKEIFLRTDVLPLQIKLKKPLKLASPTLVTIKTQGAFAGHAVRAFPSRFPIQLTILGGYPEASDITKIAELNFTELGFCGGANKRAMYLSEMRKNNLMFFPYIGSSPGREVIHFEKYPVLPVISGWWLDEVDKAGRKTPYDVQKEFRFSNKLLKEKKLSPAPYCVNICNPSGDKGYMELADALSHEYGIDFGIRQVLPQVDFINPGNIENRELRTGRRPWWPYFRNIEAVLLVDPQGKKVMAQYRSIDPREYRLLIYSCLANGAKGVLNWNYGLNYYTPKQLTWLSKKYDAIRLNMTAVREREAFGEKIPEDLLKGLRSATSEAGKINLELRLLGPLLAKGDLSNAAAVRKCSPVSNPRGGPAVFSRAIFCGLDTIVLLVINLNIDSDFNARINVPVRTYNTAEAQVELSIPYWIKDKCDVFEVSSAGIAPVKTTTAKNKMSFNFTGLKVSKAIVITTNRELEKSMREEWKKLNRNPNRIKVKCDSPWLLPGIVEELRANGYKISPRLEQIEYEVCSKLNVQRYFKSGAYQKNLQEALDIMRAMSHLPGTPKEYGIPGVPLTKAKNFPIYETGEFLKDKILSVGLKSYPYLLDFNNDGVTDLLVGDHDGFIYVFLNHGSNKHPKYHTGKRIKSVSTGKPVAVKLNPKLNFRDMNGDGLQDIILGAYDGKPYMLPNMAQSPGKFVFDSHRYKTFKTENGTLDVGNYVYPFVTDWNGDGLPDIIAGEIEGKVLLYLNRGTKTEAFFAAPVKIADIAPDMYPDPLPADIDGDGKRDLLLGSRSGKVYYFRNHGDNRQPRFTGHSYLQANGKDIFVGRLSHIHCNDWNNDKVIDLIIGNDDGEIRVFPGRKQDGKTVFSQGMLLKTEKKVELIAKTHPIICPGDWNGDGKTDIIAGGEGPEIKFWPNIGTKQKPEFAYYELIPGVLQQ
ncbi:MAG: VCBS repeat-containing protein, partial [Victivallales bacterium]